jgi:glutamate/tyrosine decarboxylase-like PLP-dependent enzyme
LHEWTEETEKLARAVLDYTTGRLHLRPVPLDGPRSERELAGAVGGPTVTAEGIGGERALQLFADVLAPACISIDHPRYFSFIPCAPTPASTLFDLVVGASSIYGGSWLEGAGAVYAENEALRWLAQLAGFPSTAGGVFVQGGTIANVSALVVARHRARERAETAGEEPRRYAVVASTEAHSSVLSAAEAMDVDVIGVEPDERGRLTGGGVARALEAARKDPGTAQPFAVVATAGTTNLGILDDIAGIAEAAAAASLWLHVDGAYGGAAMAVPSRRHLFAGIERADSFVVDPHKWLFAPFDCAALVYQQPGYAHDVHAQHAAYLEPLRTGDGWSPSDYALHLTRRARGLPFWFSLASHGTDAYSAAIERTLEVAAYAAGRVRQLEYLELAAEPELSVVAFRRKGWTAERYRDWSSRLLTSGTAFVVPTTHAGLPAVRICIVNPRSTERDIDIVLESLRE